MPYLTSLQGSRSRVALFAAAVLFSTAVGCSDEDIDVADSDGSVARDGSVKDAAVDAKSEAAALDAKADSRDAANDRGVDAGVDTGVPGLDSGDAAKLDSGDAAKLDAGFDAAPDVVDARADTGSDVATPDAALPDASVPDAAIPEASIPDVSIPTDARADVTLVEAASDSQALDASLADVSADARDSAVAEAQAPDGATADAAFEAGLPLNTACLACEQAEPDCAQRLTACDTYTGAQRNDCLALLNCVRATGCHQGNAKILTCYCGTADGSECLATSGAVIANGVCKGEFERAVGSTVPAEIQAAISTNATPNPALPVHLLIECDLEICATECVPYLSSQRDN